MTTKETTAAKAIRNAKRHEWHIRDFVESAKENWEDTMGCSVYVRGRAIAFSLRASEIRTSKQDHLAIIGWGNDEFQFGCTILTKDLRVVQLITDEEIKAHNIF